MIGRVAEDDFGNRLVSELATAGVDVSQVKYTDEPTGVALIVTAPMRKCDRRSARWRIARSMLRRSTKRWVDGGVTHVSRSSKHRSRVSFGRPNSRAR